MCQRCRRKLSFREGWLTLRSTRTLRRKAGGAPVTLNVGRHKETKLSTEKFSSPDEYLAKEREYLRALRTTYSKETQDLEKYALTVAGVIWSWCVANSSASGIKVLMFLPALTTLLFGLRALSTYRSRETIRRYLEAGLAEMPELPTTLGWERYLVTHGQTFRIATAWIFWIVLHFAAIVIGIAAWCHFP